ncbi:helix-turn-helix domain-containing protein [Brevibacterium metallidurans]|uniref:AraC family transcriptional regulator n=1 Tax=Brevibacterium metallidurans TaxID=1482676 RepID=A0ABN0ST20_9MICO
MVDDLIRAPHPALRPYLGDYVGYDFAGMPPGIHLGLPSGALTFIVAIDEPLRQLDAEAGAEDRFDVLLAGLHLRPTLVSHEGTMAGIQINLTPFAPRALFGLTAAEYSHHSVDLREVTRPIAVELHERVNAESGWAGRFAAVDTVLVKCLRDGGRLRDGVAPRREVIEAWDVILGSHGRATVARLAEHVGWSRRHLTAQLRAEVGIGPKDAARVVRFDRARRLVAGMGGIGTGDGAVSDEDGGARGSGDRWPKSRPGSRPMRRERTPGSLAEVAAVCGFADQSHLVRDFTAFAGLSPTAWLAADPIIAHGAAGRDGADRD